MQRRKESVSSRQIYRRVANAVQVDLEHIRVESQAHINVNSQPLFQNSDVSFATNHVDDSSNSNSLTLPEPVLENANANAFEVSDTDLGSGNVFEDISVSEIDIEENENIPISPSSNSSCTSIKNNNLKADLAKWSLQFNVTQAAVNQLLHILAPLHPELPLDCRTLLQTPTQCLVKDLGAGQYCHLGLQNELLKHLPDQFIGNSIHLSIGIDGVPAFTGNNNKSFWPISALIKSFKSTPFVIGMFCGKSKPHSISLFLHDFNEELKLLFKHGIIFNNRVLKVHIHSFICDAPAKAYVKSVKCHGGYAACDKCCEYGEYYNGRVIYPGVNAERRTDQSFERQTDEEHHTGISPLLELGIPT